MLDEVIYDEQSEEIPKAATILEQAHYSSGRVNYQRDRFSMG
jgi:hypothetical protein